MAKVKIWGPAVFWMALIFFFSSQPRVHVSDDLTVQFAIFKTLHILEYALLYFLLFRGINSSGRAPQWQKRYNAWIIAIGYAFSDEIHQMFIPTREGRLRDVGIDTIGITLGAWFIWKYLPTAPKRLRVWAKKLQII